MKRTFNRVLSFLKVLSIDTHLWCISVIGGAVLLCISFFVNPIDRVLMLSGNVVNAKENSIEVVHNQMNYGSMLGTYDSDESAPDTEDNSSSDSVSVNVEETTDISLDDGTAISLDDFEALCAIIQCEADSEDLKGRILVANVVLNRLSCDVFPDTIEEVITSPGQFDPVTTKSYYVAHPDNLTKEAAMRALNGEDYSDGALYFQKSTCKVWGDKTYLFRYNSHSFYK